MPEVSRSSPMSPALFRGSLTVAVPEPAARGLVPLPAVPWRRPRFVPWNRMPPSRLSPGCQKIQVSPRRIHQRYPRGWRCLAKGRTQSVLEVSRSSPMSPALFRGSLAAAVPEPAARRLVPLPAVPERRPRFVLWNRIPPSRLLPGCQKIQVFLRLDLSAPLLSGSGVHSAAALGRPKALAILF